MQVHRTRRGLTDSTTTQTTTTSSSSLPNILVLSRRASTLGSAGRRRFVHANPSPLTFRRAFRSHLAPAGLPRPPDVYSWATFHRPVVRLEATPPILARTPFPTRVGRRSCSGQGWRRRMHG